MVIVEKENIKVDHCCEHSKQYDINEKLLKFVPEYCKCGEPILIYKKVGLKAKDKNIKEVQA